MSPPARGCPACPQAWLHHHVPGVDDEPARLAADVRRLGRAAFALLEDGLGDYAVRS